MIIGIDLATKKTGLCIIDKTDNKISIKHKETIMLETFNQENLQANTNAMLNTLNTLKIKFSLNISDRIFVEYNIGYVNTAPCGLYAGLILSVFPQAIFIDASYWQTLLFHQNYKEKIKEIGPHALNANQKIRWTKIWALEKFNTLTNNKYCDWREDEIDAFWIAFLGPHTQTLFGGTTLLKAGMSRSQKRAQTLRRKARKERQAKENELKKEKDRIKMLKDLKGDNND